MIKNFKFVALFAIAFSTLFTTVSCSDNPNDDPTEQTDPDDDDDDDNEPIVIGDGSASFQITESRTLESGYTYLLKGFVYVTNNATLTIEPGVIIKGDKETKATIIIERDAKIMANGTADNPIVMTSNQEPGSRKPGDWGGLIILGNAQNNKGEMTIEGGVNSNHGGVSDTDSSGELTYVRVEFAGIEYETDNEINGITFGSVGSGTVVNHVQVSYSGDDSFEWFGGAMNASHLVSLGAWDDDFDTDAGFRGNIQFGVILRDSKYADKSASNGFEADNGSSGETSINSKPVFSNISIFGPVLDATSYTDEGNVNGSAEGFFQAGVQIRRSSKCCLFNSLIAGFPIGLTLDNDKSGTCQEYAQNGELFISGCIMAGNILPFANDVSNSSPVTTTESSIVRSIWEDATLANDTNDYTIDELGLIGDPQSLTSPLFIPSATSPLATGAVWTNSLVATGFDQVDYRGAFGADATEDANWMTGWTNFDPQNTVY